MSEHLRKAFLLWFSIILFLLLMPGCFAAISYRDNVHYSIPNPSLTSQKAESINTQYDRSNTTELLLDTWGKPDRIILKEGNKEEWVYRLGLQWKGYYFVIFPIPAIRFSIIIFPIGFDEASFHISEGKIMKVNVVVDKLSGTCGLYFFPGITGCKCEYLYKNDVPIGVTTFKISNHHNFFPLFEFLL